MRQFFVVLVLSLFAFALVCSSLALDRPEFALYWVKLARLGFAGVLLALFAGACWFILDDAWQDRQRERERRQRRRLDLFQRTVSAVWENPTRAGGWFGQLDPSNWRRAK